MTREQLWSELQGAGLVAGVPPIAARPTSPWAVRVMLGFAGWLGALFLLIFAGAAFGSLYDKPQVTLPAGVICCAAAFIVFRGVPHNDFASQFAFAISLAGQALIILGVTRLSDRRITGVFLLMALVEAALALALPNYVHRVFTTFAACAFLSGGTLNLGVPGIAILVSGIGILVWLDRVRMAKHAALLEPLGYGFALILLLDGSRFANELWSLVLSRTGGPAAWFVWVNPIVVGLVLLYTVSRIRARSGIDAESSAGLFIIGVAIVIVLCGLWAPGIAASILILVLGFANGNRVLIGLGLLAFAGYLSYFYYQLNSTLLVKSMVLALTGAALLALRWGLHRLFALRVASAHA